MTDIERMNKRVNAVCNYFADTVDEDYISEMAIKEVSEMDAENREIFFLFKKELGKCGY